ncbi:AB hydrolase superfamily protein YfhM [Seminavis robusta]|uniref:AB hydrolase superfamily protein YfhM n=1 Tax=Seminavis robusta TaxID=568900 RepID=A0A9N8HLB7_9STRA|nr:AB hydrolase superfamily protein YfhM [Seminavis robusta]|eukprot:Sro798_g203970.1 AB hydrolase superfamily protein YfhM (484) ;mRNA; r:6509-7960
MPTVLSDHSDHLSLTSLSFSSIQEGQQHYHHRFPAHFHPSYASQIQQLHHLPPTRSSSPASVQGGCFPRALHAARWAKKTPKIKPARRLSSSSTITTKHIPHHHGPKWIHRHGMINGINYHWVETTNLNEDEGVKATDKPLVILLHGFPQFWYTWRHQIVPLGDAGYRVVAPDLRGFNLTDKPPCAPTRATTDDQGRTHHSGYDMETLTEDIRALILHLGHTEANIVGHDWGGIIGWAFAARFPHHTTKLVVMNAPHLGRWRDVVMDYSSASCFQQLWWSTWYTLCCQLLPSWIPEAVLSYQRSWILTHTMRPTPSCGPSPLSCVSNTLTEGTICAPVNPNKPDGFAAPGGGGCAGCWKRTELDMYRDAISQPGAIHALLEYYRNLWLSVQQVEKYGKIHRDLPILVLWGRNDKSFPRDTYAKGWEEWIEPRDKSNPQSNKASLLTVSYLDCGHFTPEEAPADVNNELLKFFQQPLPMLSAEV